MFRALICRLPKWMGGGHKRGIPIAATEPPHVPGDQNVKRFRCPRCSRVTAYKVKAVA